MAQSVARMPSASYPASSSSLGRTRVAPASPSKAVAAEDIADDADPTYTHFAHREQVAELLSRVLALDMSAPAGDGEDEAVLVSQIGAILDYYLPMPGLLDPALEGILPPLMHVLGTQLARLVEDTPPQPDATRLAAIGRLVNWVVKVRGWKAVIPFFPSSLPHLHVLIKLLSPPVVSGSRAPDTPHHVALCGDDAWELRAVVLLWLAMLLTVPFSLTALSDSSTPTHLDIPTHTRLFSAPTSDLAVRVTLLSLPLLHRPGREGAYAALVLARLFAREDAVQGLPGFLDWASAELLEGERDREANIVASLLQFLAVLPGMIAAAHLPILAGFLDETLIPHLAGGNTAASSGLIRKLAVKARGRWWLARLGRGVREAPDAELPDGIEEVLDDLMSGLGDKDTIVRYSAAKYLARIAALLPEELSDQVTMATIGLFAGTEDEPVIETSYGTVIDPGGSATGRGAMGLGGLEASRGESRWHGVCLAVAELARRGLLSADGITELVPWAIKGLTFDLRRASYSVGANVRDAASYVLWSLVRAGSEEQLAPFAERLAVSLASAAVFDREVGVRRAASAAFQEGVGRLGLYPYGIDVLGKTDFYSVSVRRKAFTIAAPAIAIHPVYFAALREHLHNITLRHWDAAMRSAGAASLAALLQIFSEDVADSVARELSQISALDATSAHGALLALAHVAPSLSDSAKDELVASLARVRAAALITNNAAEIISAGCDLAGAALTPSADLGPITRFFEAATKRREAEVHESLAAACRRISEVRPVDAETFIARSVSDLDSSRAAQRQASALCLGHFLYTTPEAASAPLATLLRLFDPAAKADVETRRNAVRSLADICCQRSGGAVLLAPPDFGRVVNALIAALDDYTTDQRGDVGSWIRIAAIRALARVISNVAVEPAASTYISQAAFTAAVAGVAKQAFEKLDVLREAATQAWGLLISANVSAVWTWEEASATASSNGVKLSSEWFTSGLALLKTPSRPVVVAGIIQSAGGNVRASCERVLSPLIAYLQADQDLATAVVTDITTLLASNLSSNRVAVPALTTLSRLIAAGLANPVAEDESESPYSRILALGSRGVVTLKSMDRLLAAMRVVVACLDLPPAYPNTRLKAADSLRPFLSHRFPRIRAQTAEAIYLHLSEVSDELDPELEELLLETAWTEDEGLEAAEKAVGLLRDTVQRGE